MGVSLISQFSPSERELLSAFVSRSVSKGWSQQRRTIELLLYLAGEKPATEFTQVYRADSLEDFTTAPKEGFARLVEAFKLPHERVARPLNDELVAVYYECLPHEDVTLPPASGDGADFHRAWGQHYGYPESAITAFINDDCLRYVSSPEDRQTLYELAETVGIRRATLEKLPLISFLPPNDPAGLQEAVAVADDYERVLHNVADTQKLPEIRSLTNAVMADQPRP